MNLRIQGRDHPRSVGTQVELGDGRDHLFNGTEACKEGEEYQAPMGLASAISVLLSSFMKPDPLFQLSRSKSRCLILSHCPETLV